MFCDQPTGQLGCRADRSQPMAEITVVGFRVGGQLLGCPAVCTGVMRRWRKIAQIGCAGMEQARRANDERDQKCECGESAHHPYGSGPLAAASSRPTTGRGSPRLYADGDRQPVEARLVEG